ncbi:MAG: T9SS type A sorting domain-containing protein [Vicingaceae bacterium]|nr:T9SS type A sorting domain-containing protein [Vicingaceae bacterium]
MKNIFIATLFILLTYNLKAQQGWFISEKQPMPMAVANNAVTGAKFNGNSYVYSFGGIDSTKIWSGITKKSFRYDAVNDLWITLPDLPDTLGKIASGASTIDSIIYIIGGYYVFANNNEISSNRVHRFNTRTNTYLTDGMPIPVAIDDHVQAVYKDSLIFVVTGWSNTTNVPNVQIYDPANDNWLTGTATPNNVTYKAFGATGTILGDTIYYHGGASNGFNFPIQSTLRKGYINPLNPTQITWFTTTTSFFTYRAVSFPFGTNEICFLGGSATTYNFNGIAYNGSGGVSPRNKLSTYYVTTNQFNDSLPLFDYMSLTPYQGTIPMDLRGGWLIYNIIYLCGGMLDNQVVSNKTFSMEYNVLESIEEKNNTILFKTFPNPSTNNVKIVFEDTEMKNLEFFDLNGKIVFQQTSTNLEENLDVSAFPKGFYLLKIMANNKIGTQKIVVE